MGAGEIVGFALGWVFIASVMLWAVFTERRRGPTEGRRVGRFRRGVASAPVPPDLTLPPDLTMSPGPAGPPELAGPLQVTVAPAGTPTSIPGPMTRSPESDWTVIEALEGSSAQVRGLGTYLVSAWLASHRLDIDDLGAGDLRIDVVRSGDGETSTRFSVRSAILAGFRDAS